MNIEEDIRKLSVAISDTCNSLVTSVSSSSGLDNLVQTAIFVVISPNSLFMARNLELTFHQHVFACCHGRMNIGNVVWFILSTYIHDIFTKARCLSHKKAKMK
jgi:hypothetical protein